MGEKVMATPALPPGFQLVQDDQPQQQQAAAIPPLPAGFVLEEEGAPAAPAPGGYPAPVRTPESSSIFGRILDLAAGPAPLQGSTPQERQQDYRSRSLPVRAAAGAGKTIDGWINGISQLAGTSAPQAATQGAFAGGVMDGDLSTALGGMLPEAVAMAIPAGRIAKIPGLLGRVGASATAGGALGGITEADGTGARLTNMAYGAAGGALGELGGSALRALGSRANPEIVALFNQAKKFGIELSPAQLANNQFVLRAQNLLRNMPLSGASRAFDQQVAQFNRAVSREFGEDAPKITPEVFSSAKSRIGAEFDQLSARSNLTISDGLMNRLGDLQAEAAAFADDGVVRAVGSAVDRMLKQSKDGILPGPAYKSLDSTLGKIMAGGGEKSYYVGMVRDALREAMDESIAPALRQAWQQARGQYRALKTVEPLVAKSADGTISPAQLMGRVTANNAGKSSMASGRSGGLGELARIGQAMKPPSSSGTTENLLAANAFNPLAWPVMALRGLTGATAGRAANSNMLARLMADPATRVPVANGLSRLAAPAGSTAGISLAPAPVVTEPRRRDNGR